MKVSAVKCKNCGDIIWSRAGHDFHWCTCGAIAIDGGTNYTKIAGDIDNIEKMEIEVNCTEEEALNDWNYAWDKLGTIHTEESTEFSANL